MGRRTTIAAQAAVAVYGGYFGGGIGFLMLAMLTAAGLAIRAAGATKNLLAAVINLAALGVFVLSPQGEPLTRLRSCRGSTVTNLVLRGTRALITESASGTVLEAE